MIIKRRDAQLAELFRQAEAAHPDLMESYTIRLVEAGDADERREIMRAALRETVAQRYPQKGVAA